MLQALSPGEATLARVIADGPLFWYDPTFDDSSLHEGGVINPTYLQRYGTLQRQDYDPERWFSEITCPVFIAHGASDFVVPPTLWEGKVELFPRATFRLYQQSAHYPHYEEQAAFDDDLLDWLAHL
jgi:pimeloyl-ACP methyl ester carboxylesterase